MHATWNSAPLNLEFSNKHMTYAHLRDFQVDSTWNKSSELKVYASNNIIWLSVQ